MAPTVSIKDPRVETVVKQTVEKIHPSKIYLFGSRVQGIARKNSDMDLLVIYDGLLSKREVKLTIYKLYPLEELDIFVLSTNEMESLKSLANTLAREAIETGLIYYGK